MDFHRKIRMFEILLHNISRFFQNRRHLRALGFAQFASGLKSEPFCPGRRQLGQQRRRQLIDGIRGRSVVKMQIVLGAGIFIKHFAADVFTLRKSIFIAFAPMIFPAILFFGRFLIASGQFFKSVVFHDYSPRSFLRPVSVFVSGSSSFMPVYEVLTRLS